MADYDWLSASNGSGDAALMHVNGSGRLTGATTIPVDSVANVSDKFLGTYGVLGADGLITAASKRDFKGHVSGANLEIDGFLPGSTDNGNSVGDVVIIKPQTHWANTVANFIKNIKNLGTPEDLWAAILTAASAVISGALSVGGNLTASGNADVTGNLTVSGTSRVVPVSITSAATITPTSQIYDVTALAVGATVAVPSFSVANGMSLIIRIKDNGTARALSFASGYVDVSGIGLPTTTVAGKLLTIGALYNSATSKWEVQGINQQA